MIRLLPDSKWYCSEDLERLVGGDVVDRSGGLEQLVGHGGIEVVEGTTGA